MTHHFTRSLSIILINLLFSILFLSCKSNGEGKVTDNEWNRFDSSNFQIDYPNDWTLDNSAKHGTVIAILSEKANENDEFMENVNLVIQDLKGKNVTLSKFTEVSLGQIKNQMPKSKILFNEPIKVNNRLGHRLAYTGNHVIHEMIFEQYFFIDNEKAYILTFSSTKKEYDNYHPTAAAIMQTFTIK